MDSFLYAVGAATLILGSIAFIAWAVTTAAQVYQNREEVKRMHNRQDEQARRLRVVEDALKVWEKSQ